MTVSCHPATSPGVDTTKIDDRNKGVDTTELDDRPRLEWNPYDTLRCTPVSRLILDVPLLMLQTMELIVLQYRPSIVGDY